MQNIYDDVINSKNTTIYIWYKVFKSGLSKFCARQPLKSLLISHLNIVSHMLRGKHLLAKSKVNLLCINNLVMHNDISDNFIFTLFFIRTIL